jgi:hypothetical protein
VPRDPEKKTTTAVGLAGFWTAIIPIASSEIPGAETVNRLQVAPVGQSADGAPRVNVPNGRICDEALVGAFALSPWPTNANATANVTIKAETVCRTLLI